MFRSLIALLLVAATPASAYTVLGAGELSCTAWLNDRSADREVLSWTLGYLTALSSDALDILKITDAPAVLAWMEDHCRRHPLDTISETALYLDVDLIKRILR